MVTKNQIEENLAFAKQVAAQATAKAVEREFDENTWKGSTGGKPTIKEVEEYMAALNLPEVNTKGIKFDDSKLRYSLLPLDSLQEVVKVLEFGAKKYAPDNWKHVDNAEARYWDAAMRHIIAYKLDYKTDSETGLSHLAHAICCLLFLINFDNNPENNK